MNKLINKLLSVLKEHVNQNNKEIQLNQNEIDKLLSDKSLASRKKDLDAKYVVNKELLNENSDFIKLQLGLSEFLEKYKDLFPGTLPETSLKEPDDTETRKLFSQTVSGILKFDPTHPQYDNPKFFHELLKYYEIHENYEMCDKLLKQRML
jgi:hypothetical protein